MYMENVSLWIKINWKHASTTPLLPYVWQAISNKTNMYILVIYMYIFVIKMARICYKMVCMYVFVANWYIFVKYVCICCKPVHIW